MQIKQRLEQAEARVRKSDARNGELEQKYEKLLRELQKVRVRASAALRLTRVV